MPGQQFSRRMSNMPQLLRAVTDPQTDSQESHSRSISNVIRQQDAAPQSDR